MSIEEKKFEEIKAEIEKEVDDKTKIIASEILNDGTIIEMLFDSQKNETSLAICKDNEIKEQKTFTHNEIIFKPHHPRKDLLKCKVVLFPSTTKEYGSQKELIRDIQEFIHKYLSVSLFFEKISSYYVLFSWIHDDFNELPYLRGLGDYGTGKSRFLQVVGSICYRPIFASGATTVSPIFRILHEFGGTLILDEADFMMSDTTAEIIKILNSGFMKNMPVLRSVGNDKNNFDIKAFSVFSPKIIATRHLYKDAALESRMITEDMNLNSLRKDIPHNIPDAFWEEALEIRNKLLMFRFRNKGKSKIRPELENREIEPRLNQIAIPLMSIIEDGHDWAYSLMSVYDKDGSFLLDDICECLGEEHPAWNTGETFAPTGSIAMRTKLFSSLAVAAYNKEGYGPDRTFYNLAKQVYPKFKGSKKHTHCFRLGGNDGSSNLAFFERGNQLMREKYPNGMPWA